MTDELSIHLIGEVLGEPAFGLWCDRCQTSARFELLMRITTDSGWLLELTVLSACDRCDA